MRLGNDLINIVRKDGDDWGLGNIHVFCAFQIIINNTNALLYFEILYVLHYTELKFFPQIFLPLLVRTNRDIVKREPRVFAEF